MCAYVLAVDPMILNSKRVLKKCLISLLLSPYMVQSVYSPFLFLASLLSRE